MTRRILGLNRLQGRLQFFFWRGWSAFFEGVFGKSGVCVMVFCGEVVVICWWERGFWLVFFWG